MFRRARLRILFMDMINFVFIFTLFNDRYTVTHFGNGALRLMFVVFIIFNLIRLYRNFTNKIILKELTPFFVFIALTFLSMLINPASSSAKDLFDNFLLLFAVLIITVYYINYNLEKSLYFIWVCMVISVMILIINPTISEWTFRKTGGTGDPNEFASQLLGFILISVFLFRQNKNLPFIAFSSVLFIFALFKAGSLSSFLASGVITIFVLIRYLRFSFAKSIITTAITGVVILFVVLVMTENVTKIKAIDNIVQRSEKTKTAQSRFASWQAGLSMIVDKPLLGVGMNAYAQFSPLYSRIYLSKDSVAPHNVYLKTLAENGIIVFLSLFYFLFMLLTKYFKTIISSDYFWIYLVTVAYLLMGMTLGLNYNKYLWLNFALLLNVQAKIFVTKKNMMKEKQVL